MPWNAIPWFTGGRNTAEDKREGRVILEQLTCRLPRLEVVVTFGNVATQSWKQTVKHMHTLERFKHVATLHPSIRGLTGGGRQRMYVGREQLRIDLLHAKSLLNPRKQGASKNQNV